MVQKQKLGQYRTARDKQVAEKDEHCKIVWIFGGKTYDVPDMYDKSKRLCKWWAKVHARDGNWCMGAFKVVNIVFGSKTS
jgi:hypothetical protein